MVVLVMTWLVMDRTIDFNHQLGFGTIEVDDESHNRMLSAKMKAANLACVASASITELLPASDACACS